MSADNLPPEVERFMVAFMETIVQVAEQVYKATWAIMKPDAETSPHLYNLAELARSRFGHRKEDNMRSESDLKLEEEIGWEAVYPPTEDEEFIRALEEAPDIIKQWYQEQGVPLQAIPPGAELWHQGPRTKRWTIVPHEDWSADFADWLRALGVYPEDPEENHRLFEAAGDFVHEVAQAADRDLVRLLGEGE